MVLIVNQYDGFGAIPVGPKLKPLGVCSSVSGVTTTTAIHNEIPLGDYPSYTRRIFGILCWRRSAGSGSSANLQTVAFGTSSSSFDITGTVHTQSTAGNDAAGSSIGVGIVSAVVPNNKHIYMRTTYDLAWHSYNPGFFYAADGLIGDSPYDVVSAATHANSNSITETINVAADGMAIIAAGNLPTPQTMTFNVLTEDYDASGGSSLGLGCASSPRITTTQNLSYTASFAATVSARGSMAISWR